MQNWWSNNRWISEGPNYYVSLEISFDQMLYNPSIGNFLIRLYSRFWFGIIINSSYIFSYRIQNLFNAKIPPYYIFLTNNRRIYNTKINSDRKKARIDNKQSYNILFPYIRFSIKRRNPHKSINPFRVIFTHYIIDDIRLGRKSRTLQPHRENGVNSKPRNA